ncbi:hypothetical protein K1T71_010903 [Dendrolimus kikuchii]|uniref:Uncharacterized protein n=1 Tax=Dendrolimus kikuchii TaxID=765133 RepID=A0ACC1CQV4_9NEOP|nr:hypothetical protein K1T71_010903 [Dendrolimus kikuchii]
MRWKFVYCILLACSIAASLANERPKRDLFKLKKFITSKLLKPKATVQPNYKLYRIPGFNNILVKAIPKETQRVVSIPVEFLGDETANETLKALEDIKKLLKVGILNDKDDKIIQEMMVPIFQTPPVKFTELTKTYSVQPSYPSEPIIVRNPPMKVAEVISLVPDDTKYSYKQTTKDKEITTFVSQNSPDTVITTTKNVPRLPPFIKTRIEEVASMGVNPYAFATPGAVIPARPPVLVEEIVKVPTVPQGVNYLIEHGDVGTYDSSIFARPVRPSMLVKETSYFSSPPPEVVDVFNQPVTGVARHPVLVKETMKIPSYPPGIAPLMIEEQKPPVLVKETVKIPGIKSYSPQIDTRGTVNVKVNTGRSTTHNYNNQVLNSVNKNWNKKEIPLPPSLPEDKNISKNTPGFLYSFTDKNGTNNFGHNVNPTRTKISRSTSNVENTTYEAKNLMKSESIGAEPFKEADKFLSQKARHEIRMENTTKLNKTISTKRQYNKRNVSYNQFNLTVMNKNLESVAYRGDIPQLSSLSSQENEETSKQTEINYNANSTTSNILTETTANKTHLGKIDSKLVNISNDVKSPPPNLNNSMSNKHGSSRGYTKFTNRHNLEILQIKPKENVSVSPLLPPLSDKSVISQKDVTHNVNSMNSSFVKTIDDTSSSAKDYSNRTTIQDNVITQKYNIQTENVFPPPPTFKSNKINSVPDQNINLALNSKTLNSYTSFKNKTEINGITQINLSVVTSNTTEVNGAKSELESEKVDEELNPLRKNNSPTKALIQAQVDLNQIEDRITSISNKKNNNVKSNNVVGLAKKGNSTVNSNNTLINPKRNFSSTNMLNEKYKSKITKVSKTNSIFSQNKTRNLNITVKSELNTNHKTGGIARGNRQNSPISLSTKKGNIRKQDNKYALNPSRKAAINRLIGRNETKSNNLKNAVTKTALSQFSQKQTSKTSNNNRAVVKMNRKITTGERNKRDVNKVSYKIPNHYLYMPPVDVDVAPPIRPTGLDAVRSNSDRTEEASRSFKKNNINANLVRNPLIVMNSNIHVFQQDNSTNSRSSNVTLMSKV